jgi:hypothetical protein
MEKLKPQKGYANRDQTDLFQTIGPLSLMKSRPDEIAGVESARHVMFSRFSVLSVA